MARVFVMALVGVLSTPVMCHQVATTVDVAFLTGCWKYERGGRLVEEHWMAPSGGSLLGISRTVAGGKVAEFEFLQIRDLPSGLTYIAKPSGQPEASFTATSKASGEIVFENPKHDFPQKISYRLDGDALAARVEGTINVKPRSIDFPFSRVNCVP